MLLRNSETIWLSYFDNLSFSLNFALYYEKVL